MNRCRAAMMTVERPTYRKVQPLCVGTVGMHLRGGSSIRSNCSRREEEMIENPMSGQVRRPRQRAPRILRGSGCCCPHTEQSAGYVRWHYEGRQSMLPWPVPKEAHHHCACCTTRKSCPSRVWPLAAQIQWKRCVTARGLQDVVASGAATFTTKNWGRLTCFACYYWNQSSLRNLRTLSLVNFQSRLGTSFESAKIDVNDCTSKRKHPWSNCVRRNAESEFVRHAVYEIEPRKTFFFNKGHFDGCAQTWGFDMQNAALTGGREGRGLPCFSWWKEIFVQGDERQWVFKMNQKDWTNWILKTCMIHAIRIQFVFKYTFMEPQKVGDEIIRCQLVPC